jgi:hypothetical protein
LFPAVAAGPAGAADSSLMFNSRISFLPAGGLLALVLLAAPVLNAQETAARITTTTTSTGTVSEVTPDGLLVQTRTETSPLRYRYTRTTSYVDETGAPVTLDVVRSGLPVTVEYARNGEELVATRVIVQRQAAPAGTTVIERNTTITPPPQVVEKKVYVDRPVVVEKQVPVVVEKRVEVPVEKKVYVDRPVIVEKKVPVERPVIVERSAPAPVIIEEKRTTTTTTTRKDKDKD